MFSMTGIETRDRSALVWLRKQSFTKNWLCNGSLALPSAARTCPDESSASIKRKKRRRSPGFSIPADGEWNVDQLNSENPHRRRFSSEPEFMYHRGSARDAYLKELLSDGSKWPERYRIIGRPLRFVGDGGTFFPFSLGCPYDMSYSNPSIVRIFKAMNAQKHSHPLPLCPSYPRTSDGRGEIRVFPPSHRPEARRRQRERGKG